MDLFDPLKIRDVTLGNRIVVFLRCASILRPMDSRPTGTSCISAAAPWEARAWSSRKLPP